MTTYLALLRGINVGGKNRVLMADLKRAFESMGLSRVETYIQSGNVLFESDEGEAALRARLENGLEKSFGFPVRVVLRTAAELERLILDCPFSAEELAAAESANTEGESLYVSLMSQVPPQERLELLKACQSEGDECRIIRRDAYLLLRQSIRNSKLAVGLQKLDVSATVRNWKTMRKLWELAASRTDGR